MTPGDRITAYFQACSTGTEAEIAAHFTPDAVVYDTNVRPARGADAIGAMWVNVRERWGGAVWGVDSVISGSDEAAIEWHMTGTDLDSGHRFVFRGSEHYRFRDTLIDEIRQYWTFNRNALDTGLRDFDYEQWPDVQRSDNLGANQGRE